MTTDPAAIYRKLRSEAIKLPRLDGGALSALEDMQVNLVGTLMLEIDNLQAAQLGGAKIDISRVADCVKILKSLLPAATEVSPSHEHEFDGALEMFERIVNAQRGAIEAREVHLSEVLTKENAELKAKIGELNDLLVEAKFIDQRPVIPAEPQEQRSPQPPLPPSNAPGPPAGYLRSATEPWRPFVGGSRDRWSNRG
jgi:hypothetical protein